MAERVITDYDRACEVSEYVESIPCGSGHALILADEPLQSAFLRVNGTVAIGRWVACSSAEEANLSLANVPANLPELAPRTVYFADEASLVIFDASISNLAVEACPREFISPGRYEVSTERYAMPRKFEFLIHRFLPLASS